ncbi:hypothetical protein cce_2673 [Crocosphaera subtropica ATCC 51142]|uniref:Uncharacterized protein n=1 Tax=Crocosphaera subtropica (strain ATCC 51142 / BH68) TaxID=43989 RepID=B1WT99_CROS5|nr:hypothetical protein [Crocosphaera subtropica]ACB52021.1 hypothetical protein cce_2673 [Crocosphaera subtropica ATCC 51142]
MSQLTITDLNFYDESLPNAQTVEGGFYSFKSRWAVETFTQVGDDLGDLEGSPVKLGLAFIGGFSWGIGGRPVTTIDVSARLFR